MLGCDPMLLVYLSTFVVNLEYFFSFLVLVLDLLDLGCSGVFPTWKGASEEFL